MDAKTDLSRWWYVSHLFFWVASGLVCYLRYRKMEHHVAKRHLIISLWLQPTVSVAIFVVLLMTKIGLYFI